MMMMIVVVVVVVEGMTLPAVSQLAESRRRMEREGSSSAPGDSGRTAGLLASV